MTRLDLITALDFPRSIWLGKVLSYMWFTRCKRSHPELCLFLSSGGVRSLSSGRSVCNLVNHCYSVFIVNHFCSCKGRACFVGRQWSVVWTSCSFFWYHTGMCFHILSRHKRKVGKAASGSVCTFGLEAKLKGLKGLWKQEKSRYVVDYLISADLLYCLSFLHAFDLIYWATGNVTIMYSIPLYTAIYR